MREQTPGLFVTGTDTEVGKTYVAALVARELRAAGCRVGVYKPAASGARVVDGRRVSDDALALWEAAGRPGPLEQVCPQVFEAPLAPHLAARAEGRELDADLLRGGIEPWRATCDFVLVEGAGGLMSPLGDDLYVADLALEFGYPLLIVTRNVLGTINQTLQTLLAAAHFRRVPVAPPVPSLPGWIRATPPSDKPSTIGDEHWHKASGTLRVAGIVLNHPKRSPDDVSTKTNRHELIRHCRAPLLAEVGYAATQFDRVVDWLALGRGAGR